ncbi:MAG: VOC family protein [Enterococcus gilvus]
MTYKGSLVAVQDIEKAKDFYQTVLGLEVMGGCGCSCSIDWRAISADSRYMG